MSIENALPPQPTPLAASLAAGEHAPALTAYRGALTAHSFAGLHAECAAMRSSAAVVDLGWLRQTSVRGEDRFRWLNGMVTNNIKDLAAQNGAWNLVLSAQGRIQGELHVWRTGNGSDADALTLEIAADQNESLLAHFDKFIIMDDVELAPQNDSTALGLIGPDADAILHKLGVEPLAEAMQFREAAWNELALTVRRNYGVLASRYELWIASSAAPALWNALHEAGAAPVGSDALEAWRIAEAVPLYGKDMAERDLPQETGQLRALHFAKGCYLGQEIVERIRSRGNVHRHLRQLVLDGPLPSAGTEIFYQNASGQSAVAGTVTSATDLPTQPILRLALAVIRAEAELRSQPLTYNENGETGTARILSEPPRIDF